MGNTTADRQAERAARSFSHTIRSVLESGRMHLFIIGAGVSHEYVPTMEDMFYYLCDACAEKEQMSGIFREIANGRNATGRKKLDDLPRSVIYSLYTDLQNSSPNSGQEVWRKFSLDMLLGKIRPLKDDEQWSQAMILPMVPPTEFHRSLARIVRYHFPNVIIISLNFDGLMAKAIREVFTPENEQFGGLRVLSSVGSVKRFFSANRSFDSPDIPLLKLRGDIFHAICNTESCTRYLQEVPVYELDFNRVTATSPDQLRGQLLDAIRCRDCSELMKLSITFPGIRQKEQENVETVSELIQMVGPRIGSVLSIGTSGRWDYSIIDLMTALHDSFGAKLGVVFRQNPPHVLESLGDRCVPLPIDKKDLAPILEEVLITAKVMESTVIAPEPTTHHHAWTYDGVWLRESSKEDRGRESFSISLSGGRSRQTELSYSARSHELAGCLKPLAHMRFVDYLSNISQLGIKNEILHRTQSTQLKHTRKNHSVGAAFVATVWYDVLAAQHPRQIEDQVVKADREHISVAAFLHDLGHLPFGHLTEEIMRELNWTSVSTLDQYSHEDIDFSLYEESGSSSLEEALSDTRGIDTCALKSLIAGASGRHYFDQIINSGIDCDKIDYVFRDTELTGRSVRLDDPHVWLRDFLSHQELTPEGLIRLNGLSAMRAIELLEERVFLYRNFYLLPEVRILESVCRTILISWLVPQMPQWLEAAPFEILTDEDTRRFKGSQAAKVMIKVLRDIRDLEDTSLATTLEVPYLKKVGDLFRQSEAKLADCRFIEWIENLSADLDELFGSLKPEESAHSVGIGFNRSEFTDYISKFEIIGEWRFKKEDCRQVREICRKLKVEYPCTVMFDVAELPEFWSTPSNKYVSLQSTTVRCADYLLPSGKISMWNRKSAATKPALEVDFSSLYKSYAQVLVVRPEHSHRGRSLWVRDLFLEECDRCGILRDACT